VIFRQFEPVPKLSQLFFKLFFEFRVKQSDGAIRAAARAILFGSSAKLRAIGKTTVFFFELSELVIVNN
jgi:hypothetical protein